MTSAAHQLRWGFRINVVVAALLVAGPLLISDSRHREAEPSIGTAAALGGIADHRPAGGGGFLAAHVNPKRLVQTGLLISGVGLVFLRHALNADTTAAGLG